MDMFDNTDIMDRLIDKIDNNINDCLANLAQFDAYRFLLGAQWLKIDQEFQMNSSLFAELMQQIVAMSQINPKFAMLEQTLHQICAKMPIPRTIMPNIDCYLTITHQAPTFVKFKIKFDISQITTDTILSNDLIEISDRRDLEPIFFFKHSCL